MTDNNNKIPISDKLAAIFKEINDQYQSWYGKGRKLIQEAYRVATEEEGYTPLEAKKLIYKNLRQISERTIRNYLPGEAKDLSKQRFAEDLPQLGFEPLKEEKELSKEEKVIQKIRDQPERYGEIKQKLDKGKMDVHEAFKRITKDEYNDELIAKTVEPISNEITETGDIRKTYLMKDGKTLTCLEPTNHKWTVQQICHKLRDIESQIGYYKKQYLKAVERFKQTENEFNLCIIQERPKEFNNYEKEYQKLQKENVALKKKITEYERLSNNDALYNMINQLKKKLAAKEKEIEVEA